MSLNVYKVLTEILDYQYEKIIDIVKVSTDNYLHLSTDYLHNVTKYGAYQCTYSSYLITFIDLNYCNNRDNNPGYLFIKEKVLVYLRELRLNELLYEHI